MNSTPSPATTAATPATNHATPTPSTSQNGSASINGSAPRRPPRKSTLTQQQKNQKRQRATQDQLVTLEIEFEKCPTPTAQVRDRIASEIDMTERSVQIWFQNRRAKIKNIVKKSIESGEDSNDIPESMRKYLAIQAMESGKPLGRDLLGRGYGFGSGMFLNTESSSSKVVIHHFTCRSLTIGSWRRVGQSAMDLVVFYSPEKCCITYYINNDSAGYKIEYPFSAIKSISLENGDPLSNAEGASQRPGGLIVELIRPPNFYMDSSGSGGFYDVGDFTEDQQASQVLVHHLGGHPTVLAGQLAKLLALDTFQHRHNMFDPNALVASAPVSPINARPASQPNHHVVHNAMNLFHDTPFGIGVGLAHPRGHKRQRSRSVPAAIDFGMLRGPVPPFVATPPDQVAAHFASHADIVAPTPQYHHHNPMGGQPQLSIDTSAAFNMDFRQYPMSATTAPSPSDYGTPAFFSSGPNPESMPAQGPNMGPATSYQLPFMSPMNDAAQPVSGPGQNPNVVSHAQFAGPDPVIANQSPPLNGISGRGHQGPPEADLFQLGGDDTLQLVGEWKQPPNMDMQMPLQGMPTLNMTLPFRAPGGLQPVDENGQPGQNEMAQDFCNEFSSGTIDPRGLSAAGM